MHACSSAKKPAFLQEEAKRVAEQSHAAEESRAKWTAELSAREAALTQREEAAAAAARRQQEDLRKRAAHDEQVCPKCCPCRQQHESAECLRYLPFVS